LKWFATYHSLHSILIHLRELAGQKGFKRLSFKSCRSLSSTYTASHQHLSAQSLILLVLVPSSYRIERDAF
jgi:hypothetical protein